jgi:hemolysin activation/secretion protein
MRTGDKSWRSAFGVVTLLAVAGLARGQEPVGQVGRPPEPPRIRDAAPPEGPEARGVTTREDERFVPVSRFVLFYLNEHPDQPSIDVFNALTVELERTERGFERPGRGGVPVEVRVGDVFEDAPMFSAAAVIRVGEAIVREFNRRGFIGIFVMPDPAEINEAGDDLREGRTALRLAIITGRVAELRTVGAGGRMKNKERFDHPIHDRIADRSPVQPGDLIRKDLLDRYLFRLNRHPGRRVDVATAPGGQQPDEVALDYLIYEPKPWTLYVQVSNTGTEFTSEWRQRIGFTHNQLTNRDDILRVDYLTSNFENSHTLMLSYDFPLLNGRLRVRPFGSWQQYTASEVGLADEDFEGETWQLGVEAAYNVVHRRALFIDAVLGVRWENTQVINQSIDLRGEDDLFIPYIGARLERITDRATTVASVTLEGNVSGVAGTDVEQLEKMGRPNVDEDWTVIKWDVEHAFFLEPVIFRRAWRENLPPPEGRLRARGQTLAHELALSFRGQQAVGNRLIPAAQTVLGGMYSVRGYEESIAAGDSSVFASVEYRFHLPRALKIDPTPGRKLFGEPFRVRPTAPYGVTDWDLVLKAFYDVGRVTHTDGIAAIGEKDQSLSSVGLGIQFDLKRNVRLRADWGFALQDAESGARRTHSGDSRVHFEGTIFY